MSDQHLMTELTAAVLTGASDEKITAFVALLSTLTARGRSAESMRRLARVSIAQAYVRTDAFNSQLSNFVRKHSKSKTGKGGSNDGQE